MKCTNMLTLHRCLHISRGSAKKWTEQMIFPPDKIKSLQEESDPKTLLDPRNSGVKPEEDQVRHYSVLIPFVVGTDQEGSSELHLLYTKRTPFLRSHPREICFPGGRVEEGESLRSAALRETREELGIPEESIRVLSSLHPLPNRKGSGIVTPILGILSDVSQLSPNKEEVDRIIMVPLSELRHKYLRIHAVSSLEFTKLLPSRLSNPNSGQDMGHDGYYDSSGPEQSPSPKCLPKPNQIPEAR
eukprot:TRINITY_DN1112_c2_g4_i1.p1 TRINITY_DN1112_c2_g4~~TRINITY_DN1112_c2_g4_i1.p1  ORF type:complete len:244 (+),score=28.52 TRINITY_DN1112_c2_g4_i1:62-793(+)